MTLAQLRTAIKTEARVKVGTNLDDMIDSIVQEALRDFGNKARYREVYLIDQPITLVDGQSTYALPADFQHMDVVRFSLTGTRFAPLYEFTSGQLRIQNEGYPRYYQLCADGIMVFPFADIVASNTLFLSYYADPSASYVDDADVFPIPRLESAVKKTAISRVVRYMQQLDESDRVVADAQNSFVSGQGGQ